MTTLKQRPRAHTVRAPKWKAVRKGDARTMMKDATKQVVKGYDDALRKLQKH